MEKHMYRILVIGLDAAGLDLIEPWIAAGYLPHIAHILRTGAYAPMRSTIPVMSPPAWTSLITGLNPGKHGVYDFVRLLPGSYRLYSTRRDQTTYRTIFDHASAYGRYVLAVNIPITYPPAPVRGIMISGLGAPRQGRFAHPGELEKELHVWEYRRDIDVVFAPGKEQEWIADLQNVTRSQTDAMLRLLKREPWDLAMLVYRAIDEVETYFWHHMDPTHPQHDPEKAKMYGSAILKVHRLLDEEIGRLLEVVGDDTIIVLASDHGGGPVYKEVFLNVWLEQQGWLVRRRTHPLNEWRKNVMRRLHLTSDHLAPMLDFPLAWRIRNLIPQRLQHALVPESSVTLADVVDWSRTRAYSFGNIGQIYVNLRGREPQGIVEPGAEYERLLDEITEALYALTDEGQPVVDAVYRGRDLYTGPYAGYGPDLNIIMRGMTYVTQSWREAAGHQIFSISGTHYTGIHRPLGMLALGGPPIAALGAQPEVQIVDVAPTLMWLSGLPIPDDVDGRPLEEFVQDHRLGSPTFIHVEQVTGPLAPRATWTDSRQEQEVLTRLRELGYLE